ncbi:hypothetical protein KSS87_018955 [Heliosperma pusillum]|nr:hypothetical protein KSS87_018955 [Heliosperma pusillum]
MSTSKGDSNNQETDENIEMWKLKGLIKKLETAKGNGTSMISLIIPPRDQISRISKMLTEEYGTASNIKSRVNRQSVQGAITSAQQRLKLYNRVPPNGLVLYTGTFTTLDGKERKETFDFEPFKPVNVSLYLCDNRFHTEPLSQLLDSNEKYGFIVMDGNGTLFGTLSGNSRQVVHKFSVHLPGKTRRGGQSAARFSRNRMIARHDYVKKTAEQAAECFISQKTNQPTVSKIVLAGSADFKSELNDSGLLDARLKAKIVKVVDVSYGGETGFNQAIELSSECLSNVRFLEEKKLIGRFFEEISNDTGKYVFGLNDTLKAMEIGAVETLMVWENLEITRYVMENSATKEITIKHLSKDEEGDKSNFVDSATGANLEIQVQMPLLEWFVNEYKNFGCSLEFITNKSQEGSQFCRGFGGIGGLLRYQVDMRSFDENDEDEVYENDDEQAKGQDACANIRAVNGAATGSVAAPSPMNCHMASKLGKKLEVSSSTSPVQMDKEQHFGTTNVRAPVITDIAPKYHYLEKGQHSGTTDVRAARITDKTPPLKHHHTEEGQHSGATDVRAARIINKALPLKHHHTDEGQHSGATDVRAAVTTDITPPLKYHHISETQIKTSSTDCEPDERASLLKADIMGLKEKNAELRKQVRELNEKLRFAEQAKDTAQKQFLALGQQPKAGAFGTVKSLRSNPTVVPDESVNPRLAKILQVAAVSKEIIVVLANANVRDMLEVQVSTIKKAGITNYLVVALDEEIEEYCKSNNVSVYMRDPDKGVDNIGRTGGNHAVSGLKFRILREFLQLGYSVLLSDVDIIYLQNPFDYLYRDSDVESMTDGHNNQTAYGYNDVFDEPAMGWARYAHTMRIWVYNSGFFFLRPTIPSIELLDRVADRLAKQTLWDQAVFNEELYFPSHPGYEGLHASKRTMDFYSFMNSKVLFKTVRKDPNLKKFKPVIIHVNYHPDKLPRMKAVIEYYLDGKQNALDSFPDGSE